MSKETYPGNIEGETAKETAVAKPDTYYNEELSRAAVGRLFSEDGDDGPPPIESAFVTGFERASTPEAPRDKNPTKKRERPPRERERFQPPAEEDTRSREKFEPEEAPPEVRRRRETATTRLLNDDERRPPRRNPVPKPAVRVNVPSERRVRERPQSPQHQQHPPQQQQHPDMDEFDAAEEHQDPDELDAFRRRYNSDELFSPPRSPNRPQRKGRPDVRTNRIKAGDRDADAISPMRMVAVVGIVLVLVGISFLTFQMISLRSRYAVAQDDVTDLEARLSSAQAEHGIRLTELEYILANAHMENTELRTMLTELGHDPDNPLPPDENGRPGIDLPDQPPEQATPGTQFPISHTVVSGDRISILAQRFYGNSSPATLEHIRAANNLNANFDIQINQVLTFPALP